MSHRASWVDHAKGIGIILVVFGHISGGICKAGLSCDEVAHGYYSSVIYTFHMPLFFFLSGLYFIQSLSHRGVRGLLENKDNLVLYPYVVWSLLQGAMELLFAGYKNGSVTAWQVLAFPWAPRMQLWFLYTLFWVFVAGTLVFHRVPARYHGWVLLAAMGIYLSKVYVADIQPLFDIARCLVYFVLGVCFVRYQARYFALNHLILPMALVLAVLLQWYFHSVLGLRDISSEHWLKFPIAVSCIMATISLCWVLSRLPLGWLAFLGASSMYIYTMHTMIGVAVRAVLLKGLHLHGFWAHTLTASVIGIALPLLIVKHGGRMVQYLFRPPRAMELGRRRPHAGGGAEPA
jgi:fucose 4-O-acetylase-like acetyltransferase